jgi:glycine cleavage system H protein
MSLIPSELKYTNTHEWAKQENDHILIGITDYAQQLLGDVVFIELPSLGKKIKAGEEFGVIESVKAASDLFSPMSGTVTAINEALVTDPSLVNKEAYQSGWLIKIKPDNPSQWEELLESSAYADKIGSE